MLAFFLRDCLLFARWPCHPQNRSHLPFPPPAQKKANGTHGGNAVANGDLRSVTGADVQGAWRLEPERGGGGAAVGGGDAVGSEGGGRHKRPETFTSLPAPLTGGLGRPSSTMMMTPSPESRWSRSIVEGQHFGGGVDSRLLVSFMLLNERRRGGRDEGRLAGRGRRTGGGRGGRGNKNTVRKISGSSTYVQTLAQ